MGIVYPQMLILALKLHFVAVSLERCWAHDSSLCNRFNRPHYESCTSVCPSVCPFRRI